MPPIFGIINIDHKSPDPEMISRIKRAASYVLPRKTVDVIHEANWLASSVSETRDEIPDKKWFAESENLIIAADAQLYKRKELTAIIGMSLKSNSFSDAALILNSYARWGSYCLKYLYGDFAFVIINKKSNEVFCGRDPLGVRPFYYHIMDNILVFGSELRYVVEAFKSIPEMDESYLLNTLVTVKSEKNRSPFKNIFRLQPGSSLTFGERGIDVSDYWQPDVNHMMKLGDEKEYVELFREKLISAVNMRCEGASSVGSELSGGLDSSAVTGVAADYASTGKIPFTVFSNVFPADSGVDFEDEQEYIHQMLSFKNVEWTSIERLNQNILKLLQHAIEVQGCYVQQNFSIFNRGIYEAAGSKNVDILLSGFGGDEMVSARTAMPWNELIDSRKWNRLADEMFCKGLNGRALLKMIRVIAKYLYSRVHQPAFKRGSFTPELLDRRFARLPLKAGYVLDHDLKKRFLGKHSIPVSKRLSEQQLDRLMLDHVPQRMEYCYTAAAQYGLEYRYPLLDTDLIETYLAFPIWLKQHHGINRYVFREAIKGFVPEEIRTRNDKSGTTIPHTYYSLVMERDSILSFVQEVSSSGYLNSIFAFDRFKDWYEKLVIRDPDDLNYLMPGAFYQYLMMMLYYWR